MTFQFTVSPDFTPDHLSGWYIFNTWLQKAVDLHIHLHIYDDFHQQRDAIQNDRVDLIYANPFDAAMLVREKGFRALARPAGKADEAVVCVAESSPCQKVEELRPGIRLATTDDPDVHLMGMIMLEPADLSADNITMVPCDTYVLVAKELIKGTSEVGIFLQEAYNDLSSIIRRQLRVLVSGQIQLVHHCLMVGPNLLPHREQLLQALLGMGTDPKGPGVLEALKFSCWEAVDDEEAEFMIDLMDTLNT
jgi:phosphonate transport system substrate-binding protein